MNQKKHCSICKKYWVVWEKKEIRLTNSQIFPGAFVFFIGIQHWNSFQETDPNTNIFKSDNLK